MNAFRQQNSGRRAAVARALGIFAALVLLAAPRRAQAASDTWTNYVAGHLSDFWTNSASWNPAVAPASGDNVYLTNSVNLAYTNILNVSPTFNLGGLIVSNSLGEAWLDITNVSVNAPLTLGSGGRVVVEGGSALVAGDNATLNFAGINGVLYINNGALLTFGNGDHTGSAFSLFGGVSGVTGMVASLTGPGGIWDNRGGSFTLFSGFASNNQFTISAVTLTNLAQPSNTGFYFGTGANASGNTLILTNSAYVQTGYS